MYGRRRLGMPIAMLAFAQLLLPSFGVAHAHGSKNIALDAGAAERRTVHAHGAGLAHDHAPGPFLNIAGVADAWLLEATGLRRLWQ